MHIVRRSAFKAVPWKNGGGITHEVTRVPTATPAVAGADAFRWRVSVAEIDASGPFSEFPDHHRIMVLLRGGGVRLSFSGGEPFELHSVGDCVSFDGAWSTQCTLLDGPCTDLNLMVSKASPPAHAQVLRLTESVALGEGTVTLLFAIAGAVSVHGDQGISRLDAWDCAIADPNERLLLAPASDSAAAAPIPLVFCANLAEPDPHHLG